MSAEFCVSFDKCFNCSNNLLSARLAEFDKPILDCERPVTIYNMLGLVLFLPGFIMTTAFITSKWVAWALALLDPQ